MFGIVGTELLLGAIRIDGAQVRRGHAARHPAVGPAAGRLVGPAGVLEAVGQVVEVGLRDIDAEGRDLHVPGGAIDCGRFLTAGCQVEVGKWNEDSTCGQRAVTTLARV